MSRGLFEFEQLLHDTLIPDWVGASDRDMEIVSFAGSKTKLSEFDAAEFMRAWNSGMLNHFERGRYRFRENGSLEQFFSSGLKAQSPRSFTLWLEPIIQVGSMARLHFDFGWPEDRIGTQSKDGAFDVVAFRSNRDTEAIAGEVKKTELEAERLIELMFAFGLDPNATEPKSGSRRNAFKKVYALRQRRPPIFWTIGPDRYSKVYSVRYFPEGQVEFVAADKRVLRYDR
jgi:hypothetical protein